MNPAPSRALRFVATVVVASIALTACGGGTRSPQAVASAPGASSASSAASASAPSLASSTGAATGSSTVSATSGTSLTKPQFIAVVAEVDTRLSDDATQTTTYTDWGAPVSIDVPRPDQIHPLPQSAPS